MSLRGGAEESKMLLTCMLKIGSGRAVACESNKEFTSVVAWFFKYRDVFKNKSLNSFFASVPLALNDKVDVFNNDTVYKKHFIIVLIIFVLCME